MKYSTRQNFLLTLLLFISSSLFGQKFEPKKRPLEPDTTISSKIMGKDYQLYISFPSSYSSKDTIKYPVLYVLDGAYSFPIINASRVNMDFVKELENVIIVCIGSGLNMPFLVLNRYYDYTPSVDTGSERRIEKGNGFPKGSAHSGGADKFLRCITTEIIPYIDTHYMTNHDNGIAGHSLGGLFVAYCLLNSKDVFTRFHLSSPSLWWNNNEILNRADSLFKKNKSWDILPTKILLTVGQKETPIMVSSMIKFSTLLEDRANKNVWITRKVFDDETHISGWTASLSSTLSVLYRTKKMLLKDTIGSAINHKGITSAIELYKALKASKSQWFSFDEVELNALGYELLQANKISEAIAIFKLNTEEYPTSWNVFDSMGEAYMANGDFKLAIESYQKSVDLNPTNKGGIDALIKLKGQ